MCFESHHYRGFSKPMWLLRTCGSGGGWLETGRLTSHREAPLTAEKGLVNHLGKARENRFMGRKFSDRLVTLNRGFIHA